MFFSSLLWLLSLPLTALYWFMEAEFLHTWLRLNGMLRFWVFYLFLFLFFAFDSNWSFEVSRFNLSIMQNQCWAVDLCLQHAMQTDEITHPCVHPLIKHSKALCSIEMSQQQITAVITVPVRPSLLFLVALCQVLLEAWRLLVVLVSAALELYFLTMQKSVCQRVWLR